MTMRTPIKHALTMFLLSNCLLPDILCDYGGEEEDLAEHDLAAEYDEYDAPMNTTLFEEYDLEEVGLEAAAVGCYQSKLKDLQTPSKGRIPDFSRAGYRQSDFSLPTLSPSNGNWFNVKDFGAKGDTSGSNWKGSDDYPAIKKALNTLKPGSVLYFPPGKYTISKDLVITKSISLKGAGPSKTVLHFPNQLADLYGMGDGKGMSMWSFGPGLLVYKGAWGTGVNFSGTKIASITAKAGKGAKSLTVDSVKKITPGMWVVVSATDKKGSLMQDIYGGYKDNLGQRIDRMYGWELVNFFAKVSSVNPAQNKVTIDRALNIGVDPIRHANVILRSIKPTISNAGIEDLTVRSKASKYLGHHAERGANGIEMRDCFQMWIRNVQVVNADNSIMFMRTHFSTVTGVTLLHDSLREKEGKINAHHGLWVKEHSSNNLFTNFDIQIRSFHDATVELYAHLNVYKNGKGIDMGLEHHTFAPWANLYTNLNLGVGIRGFKSGGPPRTGAHAGMDHVYWNIRSSKPITLPGADFGPKLTFVGVNLKTPVKLDKSYKYDWHVEMAGNLCMKDLHAAQLAARQQKKLG